MAERPQGTPPAEQTVFGQFLGFTLLDAKDGVSHVRMDATKRHVHPGGVQGGAFMAFMDHAVHHAVTSLVGPDQTHTTIEFKVNFMRPGKKGDALTATSTVISRGSRIMVAETEVRNQNGDLLTKSISTEMVIPKPQGAGPAVTAARSATP
jgi:uncharacterized protein (TIGR00369 family)